MHYLLFTIYRYHNGNSFLKAISYEGTPIEWQQTIFWTLQCIDPNKKVLSDCIKQLLNFPLILPLDLLFTLSIRISTII